MSGFDYSDFKRRVRSMTDGEFYRSYDDVFRAVGLRDYTATNLDIVGPWIHGDLLDVGCAAGGFLAEMWGRCTRCVGVDVSEYALGEARKIIPSGVELLMADVEKGLPFRDGEFDVVVCGFCFEHFRGPEAAAAEIRRVCHGEVVILIPLQTEEQANLRENLHINFWKTTEEFERFWGKHSVDAVTARNGMLGILRFDCRKEAR